MQDEEACGNCGWSWSIAGEGAPDDSGRASTTVPENSSTTIEDRLPEEASATSAPALDRSDGQLWFELSVVAAVTVIPAFYGAMQGIFEPFTQSYTAGATNLLVFSVCAAWVPIYLIRNNGESLSDFGIKRPQLADIIAGILIVPFVEVLWIVYWDFIPLSVEIPLQEEFVRPTTSVEYSLMVASHLANAFHEELVLRAYLITRLCVLLKSRRRAVIVAAAVFASYHIYQGAISTGGIFLFGIFFGVLWLLFRRLWPLVIAHAISNILLEVFDWW